MRNGRIVTNSLIVVILISIIAILLGGCASSVEIGGSTHHHDHDACHEVLRAQRFELVDQDGLVRAEIGIDEAGSTGVFIHDHEGRLRASLTHGEE